MKNIESQKLLSAQITTGVSEAVRVQGPKKSFQVVHSTTAGAGAATVKVQVSNVENPTAGSDTHWVDQSTFTLTLSTTLTSDGNTSDSNWRWTRFKVTAISGTNASIDAYIACEV